MATVYFRYTASGGVGQVYAVGDHVPALPDGAVEITEGEYDAESATIRAGIEQHLADTAEQEQAAARADYDALTALGVPVATARRLTGVLAGGDPA